MLAFFKRFVDLVKFEHTIFALPFALSAMLLAQPAWPAWSTVGWVILAMVGGRTYAMGLNRLIDAQIDARNPRTAQRAIPAGRVPQAEAWAITLVALLALIGATIQLPPLCLMLLPIAIVVLTVYSFVKRFSSLAHLVLGFALGCSAIGGWIAVTGSLSAPAIWFGVAVMTWVAGFDIIYACQDVEFDQSVGLFSIPAKLGMSRALEISRFCHIVTVSALVAVGILVPHVGWGYWAALLFVAAMLVYEQSLVRPDDLSRVDEAFFNLNGIISCSVLLCLVLERVLEHWLGL